MNSNQHIIALLLSGGIGSRFDAVRPKQYIEVKGQPVIGYTMMAFEQNPLVTDIVVVCMPEWHDYVTEKARNMGLSKFRRCLASGCTGYESLLRGIEGLEEMHFPGDSIVLVHDAVRPLVSSETITDNIITCHNHGNAITVVDSHEAFLRIEPGHPEVSTGYASRDEFMRAQTPHTFPLSTITRMLAEAKQKGITESQSLFTLANELGEGPLHTAKGDLMNFKITRPNDLMIFRGLLEINR